MLRDLIVEYSKALSGNDDKEIIRIEKQLKRLGMDVLTARYLVKQYREGKL